MVGARGRCASRARLILESTFSSLRELAHFHHPRLSWLVPADKLNSAKAIPKNRGRLLQSHGAADRLIPLAHGQNLFAAANEPKQLVVIPAADHNDPQSAAYYVELDRFFDA